MTIRLGYQIPNFTYAGIPNERLFETVVAQAREAEASGFDTVLVMDHFYQLPGLGTPDNPMLEAYTALAGIAASTSTIQVSTLVTGNTYRNPPMLAKTVTTLDLVSKGRAILGIGAGWFEREHDDFGYEFGTFTDRFEKLEEALNIIAPMLRGENPTFSGKWYSVRNAMNNPRLRPTIPIMLGGSGEKKTFRLAALFADHMNIICAPADLPRKVAALRERCEEAGRDPSTLATSFLTSVLLGETEADVKGVLDGLPEAARARAIAGTPEQVAEMLQERVLDQGITGLTINMPMNGHRPGIVTLAGEALKPLVS
ncbi:LLM class F420-dependent oxidoreductase [Cryptosporangium sp. NPDC051539]|uniref:LLM class F420-dependent oxidoreductase n=1 Tax=Cryptosporangium sp. NPDC051539 TaxID=3363962 RepID=UPI0037B75CBE